MFVIKIVEEEVAEEVVEIGKGKGSLRY